MELSHTYTVQGVPKKSQQENHVINRMSKEAFIGTTSPFKSNLHIIELFDELDDIGKGEQDEDDTITRKIALVHLSAITVVGTILSLVLSLGNNHRLVLQQCQ